MKKIKNELNNVFFTSGINSLFYVILDIRHELDYFYLDIYPN